MKLFVKEVLLSEHWYFQTIKLSKAIKELSDERLN